MGLKIEYKKPTGRTATGRKKVGANLRSRARAEHKYRQDMMKGKTTNLGAVRPRAKKKKKK